MSGIHGQRGLAHPCQPRHHDHAGPRSAGVEHSQQLIGMPVTSDQVRSLRKAGIRPRRRTGTWPDHRGRVVVLVPPDLGYPSMAGRGGLLGRGSFVRATAGHRSPAWSAGLRRPGKSTRCRKPPLPAPPAGARQQHRRWVKQGRSGLRRPGSPDPGRRPWPAVTPHAQPHGATAGCSRAAHQPAAVAATVATTVANAVATTHRSASSLGIHPNGADLPAHRHTPNTTTATATVTTHRTERVIPAPSITCSRSSHRRGSTNLRRTHTRCPEKNTQGHHPQVPGRPRITAPGMHPLQRRTPLAAQPEHHAGRLALPARGRSPGGDAAGDLS